MLSTNQDDGAAQTINPITSHKKNHTSLLAFSAPNRFSGLRRFPDHIVGIMQCGIVAAARGRGCVPKLGGGDTTGLTGRDIVELVRLCTAGESEVTARFAGVYSALQLDDVDERELDPLQRPRDDRLERPRARRAAGKRCVLVVNVFEHWVTICLDTKLGVLYLDSYGKPPSMPPVKRFIKRMCRDTLKLDPNRHTYYNGRQVQAWTSNYCGMFAVLWTLCLIKTAGDVSDDVRNTVADAKIRFFKAANRLQENDKLCGEYLRRLGETKSLSIAQHNSTKDDDDES